MVMDTTETTDDYHENYKDDKRDNNLKRLRNGTKSMVLSRERFIIYLNFFG